MASSNDHISLQSPATAPKSRLSPLDFRNTELVSRLLAATPPYLYNMSLLPNSYFFSEMLRSLVQAKHENSSNHTNTIESSIHHRRSRKRSWIASRHEEISKNSPKLEKNEVNEWNPSIIQQEPIRKSPNNTMRTQEDFKSSNKEKQTSISSFQNTHLESANSGLILPPAPPVWFPPIYPSPYVDPLHFFIDLRVSGHIYDKTQKDNSNFERSSNKEVTSTMVSPNSEYEENAGIGNSSVSTRYGRHNSAFSVPVQKSNKNLPMNLSQTEKENKCRKFDVKSLGFEKNMNKIGTSYIMPNIQSIYKDVKEKVEQRGEFCESKTKFEDENSEGGISFNSSSACENKESLCLSPQENSLLEVVDNEDQEFKIDVQS